MIDAYASGLSPGGLGDLVAGIDPSAVVVTSTPSMLYWRCPPMSVDAPRQAIDAVHRASSAPVTLIGPHATATPEWALQRTGADWCYRGAFERELPGILINGSYRGSPHVCSSLENRGTVSVLPAGQLPRASFGWLAAQAGYEPHMWSVTDEELAAVGGIGSGVTLEASRGCPWSCVYCAKEPVRGKFDRRPLADLVAEIEEIARLGVEYVFFIDETFNIQSAEFRRLLGLLGERGIRFGFQGRPDLIDRRMAEQLRAAGCIYAELGIDTVSNSLSSDIGRRQSLERARGGVEVCREYIPIVRFNRLNLQTGDYREMFGDVQDDWEYPPDPAFPYPGAALGERVMRTYGYPSFDWDFARRYSWWLRIEVFLHRKHPYLDPADVRSLQGAFLGLTDTAATEIAAALGPVVMTPPEFHAQNKIVMRRGPGVRTRSSGTQ